METCGTIKLWLRVALMIQLSRMRFESAIATMKPRMAFSRDAIFHFLLCNNTTNNGVGGGLNTEATDSRLLQASVITESKGATTLWQ